MMPDKAPIERCVGPTCGARIRWIVTPMQKLMPVAAAARDWNFEADGPVVVVTETGAVVRLSSENPTRMVHGFAPHWGDCPDRELFRRRRR